MNYDFSLRNSPILPDLRIQPSTLTQNTIPTPFLCSNILPFSVAYSCFPISPACWLLLYPYFQSIFSIFFFTLIQDDLDDDEFESGIAKRLRAAAAAQQQKDKSSKSSKQQYQGKWRNIIQYLDYLVCQLWSFTKYKDSSRSVPMIVKSCYPNKKTVKNWRLYVTF